MANEPAGSNSVHRCDRPVEDTSKCTDLLDRYLQMSAIAARVFTRLSLDDAVFLFKIHQAWHDGHPFGYKFIRANQRISHQALKARVHRLTSEGWITLQAGLDKRTTHFQPSAQLEQAIKNFVADVEAMERHATGAPSMIAFANNR